MGAWPQKSNLAHEAVSWTTCNRNADTRGVVVEKGGQAVMGRIVSMD